MSKFCNLEGRLQFGTSLKFASREDEEAAMRDFLFHERVEEEKFEDDLSPGGGFNPKLSEWKDSDLSKPPDVFVDKARTDIYNQFKDEHDHVINMIEELPFEGDDHEKVAKYLFGKDSKVYRCFHDAISLPHNKFCQFMATFFFVCRMNQNYNEMCADKHNARRQTLAWLDS